MNVWRCSILSVAAAVLSACAAVPPPRVVATPPLAGGEVCHAYVRTWVNHFRASVADSGVAASERQLLAARAQLSAQAIDAADCELPNCMIVPLSGGRLDSYCGYRRLDPSRRELYQWVPYR
ncbi:MAG: hypothetical protein EPN35_09980 [Rhodanobacter sp.]|uniref:hypothetical protein n=1 Tax=Rhodanobacter TaxID=75309 RepID=UPI0012065ECE|nr:MULTISPECIES: hypothetical protein [Rhodanobacter]TAN16486.1 MAG: hypothetical protein EPN35_09980 [Rhodanobacter sp.]UJJ54509.1 hypothetical protein LRK53_16380 [Rhodanobacter thiooxydans]